MCCALCHAGGFSGANDEYVMCGSANCRIFQWKIPKVLEFESHYPVSHDPCPTHQWWLGLIPTHTTLCAWVTVVPCV